MSYIWKNSTPPITYHEIPLANTGTESESKPEWVKQDPLRLEKLTFKQRADFKQKYRGIFYNL